MSDVSRETGPPSPEAIKRLFPERHKEINLFVDLLATVGVERGLIGPREAPRLWSRHIINCAAIRSLFPRSVTVADIGSGAGLPGLVLALSRPDLQITLIEPLLRRTTFLSEAVALMGLEKVEVVRARAEDIAGSRQFDYVTARAVAPLERLATWALPLCRAGGELIAMKGASAADELVAAADVLKNLKAGPQVIEQWAGDNASSSATVVRIQSSGYVPSSRKGRR